MNQDQLRDQIAGALHSVADCPICDGADDIACRWKNEANETATAVVPVVAPLLAERDDQLTDLKWLHAEAAWHRDQLDAEALKWTEVAGRHAEEIDRLHSWAGLMELLDEHWPADIFAGDGSNEDADPGARIVALVREVDRLRREVQFEACGADTFSGADRVYETREEGEECSGRDDTGQASREDIAAKTLGRGLTTTGEPVPGDVTATPAPLSSRPISTLTGEPCQHPVDERCIECVADDQVTISDGYVHFGNPAVEGGETP